MYYLDWLNEYAGSTGCALHACVLMTNHVHLLLTSEEKSEPAVLMKRLGQCYVQYVNRTYRRSGTLWEGRFRSCMAQWNNYLLLCQKYIELNPIRAGIVAHPGEYRWSSYRANAQGGSSDLLYRHPVYMWLGGTDSDRQAAYWDLFRYELEPGVIDQMPQMGSMPFGSERFQKEITDMAGRRATPGKPGRPRKKLEPTQG